MHTLLENGLQYLVLLMVSSPASIDTSESTLSIPGYERCKGWSGFSRLVPVLVVNLVDLACMHLENENEKSRKKNFGHRHG